MKEAITKFDLEAAFKALDEIDVPVTGKVRANKPALTEIFSRKSKFDSLMEEYYDISSMDGLDDAKEAREAEVAQAKLARIEKIVDLEAESPEDLLPSYVGKFIIQCPQCMTLFYKNPEDVEASEEDPNTVNISEVCQHCGNDAGYTLIGKVGEATQEEQNDLLNTQEVDVDSTEESEFTEETVEVEEAENLDQPEDLENFDLDAIDLDLEGEEVEEEESDKKEESYSAPETNTLVEELRESQELDVSADEFAELINSPEFKKPISDADARAMMNELEDTVAKQEKKELSSKLTEAGIDDEAEDFADLVFDIFNSGKFIHLPTGNTPPKSKKTAEDTYRVTHRNGGGHVDVKILKPAKLSTDISFTVDGNKYTAKNISEVQNIILKELDAAYVRHFDIDLDESVKVNNEVLRYAVINPDGTYAGVPCITEEEARDLAAQREGRIIVKLAEITESLEEGIFDVFKSRAGKAEWVLKNALIDYEKAILNKDGDIETKKENQKFNAFVVVCYKNTDVDGKKIESTPNPANSNKLVAGTKYPDVKTKYADAEKIAKGWSMKSDGGPAFIYLAKNENDNKAVFLCQYFAGQLDTATDRLDAIIETIKRDQKGSKLRVKGGTDQSETKKTAASNVKAGMRIQLDDGTSGEVTKITPANSRVVKNQFDISIKYDDGETEVVKVDGAHELSVLRDSIKTETLSTAVAGMEELQEDVLESLISNSLIEAYANVAGFKLTECAHMNEKFSIDGTIYFTSGNTRKTTYTFNEAFTSENGKISLVGLNEKLGADKKFIMTGSTNSDKVFITESFKRAK